jgi:hypothetical protein
MVRGRGGVAVATGEKEATLPFLVVWRWMALAASSYPLLLTTWPS